MIVAYVPRPTPQTNADRIRAMSDEELAGFLYSCNWCDNNPMCAEMFDLPNGVPEEMCKACALRWLEQPAKEERTK